MTRVLVLIAAALLSGSSPLRNPHDAFWTTAAPAIFEVRFETTKGTFIVEAHRDWAPRGVDRFYNLARSDFFNDSRFFRVHAGFVAQFGIPGDAEIAKLWRNERIPDDPARQSNTRGTIAYAMAGQDARTTQLFINLADNTKLDAQGFAPIGKIKNGMEVVDQLYSGYGEESGGGMRAGRQDKLFTEGNAWLDREFPKLDKLVRAVLL